MGPSKFGVAYFLDGHTEDIIRAEHTLYDNGREYLEFETASGTYSYAHDIHTLDNGLKVALHQFRNEDTQRIANISSVCLIKYERKEAKAIFLKGETE